MPFFFWQDLKSHPDLTHMLGLADLDAGAYVAGARGYFLLHEGVLLNQVRWCHGLFCLCMLLHSAARGSHLRSWFGVTR